MNAFDLAKMVGETPNEMEWTADETTIYKGYKQDNGTWAILRSTVGATSVSNKWAYGDWADRTTLQYN